jgi:hypothetical protein
VRDFRTGSFAASARLVEAISRLPGAEDHKPDVDEAEARITAALAAGGRMVRDDFAPSWWTLADAAGNEVDIATTRGRD